MTAEKLSTGGAYGAENERKRGKTAACADAKEEDSKASAGGGDNNGGADLCAAQAGYTVSVFKGGEGSLTSEVYTEKWAEVIKALLLERGAL